MRTVGVEEEYLLVGPDGVPVALAAAAIRARTPADEPLAVVQGPGGDLESELKQQMIETGTHPCEDLSALAAEVRAGRARAGAAAEAVGAQIAPLGTSPFAVHSSVTPHPRYRAMVREFALTAREQLTCGCHVHVQIADDEEGVAVLDRIGPWLPPLLALTANSPFWQGQDSGYASYRSQVWNRWPTSGPVPTFGSAQAYHDTVSSLVASGTILDTGMIYFDARLSAKYPTLEVRVADVCLDPDDAVLLAALVRGLVETAAREAAAGVPPAPVRVEQLRAASWRAGRSGLVGDLVSPRTMRPAPAQEVLDELVEHVTAALVDAGDLDAVRSSMARLRGRGTGAERQRAWFAERGELADVVTHAVEAGRD